MEENDNKQPLSIDEQIERLMKLESVYDNLSEEKQGWIYEEFKRLITLQNKNKKKAYYDKYFFNEEGSEELEPSYCNSELYQKLFRKLIGEKVDEALNAQQEYNNIPKEKQKKITETFKRILREKCKTNIEEEKKI